MTLYLTPQQVLFIHHRLMRETGGDIGLRDLNSLKTVLTRPGQLEKEKELYPGLYKKSAVLLDGLVKERPFLEGNKRTAIAAVDLFLRINGQRLAADEMEMVRFVRKCAGSPVSLEFITAWVWQYARPLRPVNIASPSTV